MGIGDWTEADLERFIQRVLDKPRVEKTQAADLRSEVDALRDDVDTLTVGATPSGPAGGDLDGTYPNPIIRALMVTNSHVSASAGIDMSKISGLVSGLAGKAATVHSHTASDVSNFDTAVRANRLDQMAQPTANVPMNGRKLTSLTAGTTGGDSVEFDQFLEGVELAQLGFTIKSPVAAIETSPLPANTRTGDTLTANAPGALPGYATPGNGVGARYLIAGEGGDTSTPHVNNGIYILTDDGSGGVWSMTRAPDAVDGVLEPGAWIPYANPLATVLGIGTAPFVLATSGPITVNTTALQFVPTGTTMEGIQKDCGSDLTVGTSAADVNNLTYTAVSSGKFLVTFNLDVLCTSTGGVFIGSLNVGGSDIRNVVWGSPSSTSNQNRNSLSLTRRVTVVAGQVIKVRAIRVLGGYTIEADNSSMTVQRVA